MSYKHRRQSLYLNRKSFSRTNSSMDPNGDDLEHHAIGSGASSMIVDGNTSALQQIPPPPSIESMKVIKGFEYVTFNPVEIKPPSTVINEDSLSFESQSNEPHEPMVPPMHSNTQSDSNYVYSGSSPTESMMVKSFDLDRMPDNIVTHEITDSEAREALHTYVCNKFCYGTKAANQMTIRDMIHSFVFQYSLESFCEKRQLCWTYEPYADACITIGESSTQGCSLSVPDNAWSIEVNEIKHLEWYLQQRTQEQKTSHKGHLQEMKPKNNSSSSNWLNIPDSVNQRRGSTDSTADQESSNSVDLFQNKVINVTVPGTVSIHSCHNCGGVGRKRCTTCAGSGSKSCQTCTGNGYYGGYYHKSALTKSLESSDYCWRCHGRGRLRCYGCNGDGMTTCAACFGSGQIKCYIKMIVTLTNHQDNVLIRDHHSAEVPLDLLSLADGDLVFEEEGHNTKAKEPFSCKLYHITNFVDESITRESERLIRLHEDAYLRSSRLILQRHRVKVIPLAKVIAFWQRKQFHFYVFGSHHHRCYTANYPQRYSCPCCSIV